jgi:hypothetical protein
MQLSPLTTERAAWPASAAAYGMNRCCIPFSHDFLYVQRNIAVPRPAPPLVLRAADPPAAI